MKKQHWMETQGLREFMGACEDGWNAAKPDVAQYKTVRDCWEQCDDYDILLWAIPSSVYSARSTTLRGQIDTLESYLPARAGAAYGPMMCALLRTYLMKESLAAIYKEFPKLRSKS